MEGCCVAMEAILTERRNRLVGGCWPVPVQRPPMAPLMAPPAGPGRFWQRSRCSAEAQVCSQGQIARLSPTAR